MLQRYRSAASLLVLFVLAAAIALTLSFRTAKALAEPLINSTVKAEVMRMPPDVMRSLIERAANSWIKGDAKAFAALFAPNGEFVVPGQRLVGAVAIEKIATEFAKNNAQVIIKIQRIIIDHQQAVVEWHWESTENRTGDRTRADDAIVIDFADGKIKRWREYIDSETPRSN